MYDLHMHSTFSDGSDNIESLIDNVKKAGIDFFSITDHDTALSARTILSSDELQQKIKSYGLTYAVGVEWTCSFNGYGMHILAYDFNPFAPEVLELEQEIKEILKGKSEIRFNAIIDMGYKFSDKSIEFLNSRINIKRLDFANCLVNDGYFANIQEANEKCINLIKYPSKFRLNGEKVISTLSKIGAKLVWAHSIRGLGKKPISFEEIEKLSKEMKKIGLAGLECYYSLYTKEEIEKLVEIAHKLDLFVTCGSDYHGQNRNSKLAQTSCDGTKTDENEIKVSEIFVRTIK